MGLSSFGTTGVGDKIQGQVDIFKHSMPTEDKGQNPGRQQILDRLSDQIRRKFGKDTIRRGKAI
jgi:hypothetical protein